MNTLADIYAAIPAIECKGLCHGSCGPVPAARAEVDAIEKVASVPWGVTERGTCVMLCAGRCTVYVQRPLLCRLWGVTRKMPCPFGCVPERWIEDAEGRMLLRLAGKFGGGYDVERIAEMAEKLVTL